MPPLFYLPIVVLALMLPVFLSAELRGRKWQRVLPLKMVCSLSLVALGLLGVLLQGEQTHPAYDTLLVIGLCFSLLGDLALVWKNERKPFMLGLAAFLIAQVLYGIAFSLANGFSGWDVLLFAALFLGPVIAYRFLDMDVGRMKVPVLAYILVIAFMFAKALSALYLGGIPAPALWLAIFGAGLFYLSDALLALFKFHRRQMPVLRALNLSTYFIGQALLALSVFYF